MGKFDDLLGEAKQKANETKQAPKTKDAEPKGPIKESEGKRPDALVLVTKVQRCDCGSTYESPNPLLLFRYGRTKQQVDHWPSTYNALPREVEEVEEEIPTCPMCFESSQLEAKRVISKRRK